MAHKSNSTSTSTLNKPAKAVVGNNRPKRTPAQRQTLIELGVPPDMADDFPLTPHHGNGSWCKKVRNPVTGKSVICYFGKFAAGWREALDLFDFQKADLFAGRPARRPDEQVGLTLLNLCNRFLHFKRALIAEGTLSFRSWKDYHSCCQRVMTVFGENRVVETLGPEDFEELRRDFGKTWGAVRIGNEINRTRILFNYAFEQELVEKPVRYGQAFKRPDRKAMRKVRQKTREEQGVRMFEAEEIRKILDVASPLMKAMVLLAANCGFGNADVGVLTFDTLDLKDGWVRLPRPKTGVERDCPLWPETIDALKEWLSERPAKARQPEHDGYVFLTQRRLPWFRDGRFVEDENAKPKVVGIDGPVSKAFAKLLKAIKLNGHRGFYSLRHGFETISGDTGDQVAVNHIMGHADQSMAGVYRERIDPARLKRVVEHVRHWLFGKAAGAHQDKGEANAVDQ
jgi:integrase